MNSEGYVASNKMNGVRKNRGLRFSRWWRFKSRSCGFWCRV